MDSKDKKDFIDIEYSEVKDVEERIINGEPLFYTVSQVADMVGEPLSTIRFWTKKFKNLLDVEVSNKNNQYKKSDVSKLKFIRKLAKEDGLTLRQVNDYCSLKGFNIDKIEQSVIDSSNPLAIQAFTSAITVEMNKKFNEFAVELLDKIKEQQKASLLIQEDSNDKLQEQIAYTVDNIISEKLENLSSNVGNNIENQLQIQMDEQERRFIERDIKNIELIKQHMDERKKENEIEQEKKKGFWNKLNIWFKK